ncbi:MAG: hypothetical protein ACRC30_11890 [Clostridium sp.]
MKKVINLNLITTYPVKWSKYKVLRDFIQNFYDSVPREEFNSRFSYEYRDRALVMRCKDVSYNYEWLLHIGASSKTESEESYAGYFGEGFKIAALCANRDFKYEVETWSSDWSIRVIESEINIDGMDTKSLAYELEKGNSKKKDTGLILRNFSEDDMEYFKSALYSFYYKENPLLGEEIYSDKNYGIYYRSDVKKEEGYPGTFDCRGEGIIFAAFQARGSLKEPLVFCKNNYIDNDRERDFFSKIDNINIIVSCIREVPPKIALKLLMIYKDKWYEYPEKSYGYSSYYTVIKNLILRVSWKKELIEEFNKLYPDILYAKKIKSSDKKAQNIRKYCLAWVKGNPEIQLVQDNFRWINVQSLENRCEELRILPEVRDADSLEKGYVKILEDCIKDIFEDFFETDDLPECRVVINLKASVSGYASITKLSKNYKNNYGYTVKYKLHHICIKNIYLNAKTFGSALSIYVHELCHSFGGDKSENFSYALTMAMELLLDNLKKVNRYREQWSEYSKKKRE